MLFRAQLAVEQIVSVPKLQRRFQRKGQQDLLWSPARQPVVSVVSVSLVDAETGAAAAMDGADWRLVPTPGGHVVEFDAGSIAGDEYALVTWTAGYSAVQPLHKAWLLRTLANRYRFRGDDPEGRGAATDTAADWLRQSMARSVIA